MTSWLDAVLSPFLHTVDDYFREFWTNACYYLVDSLLQLCDSVGTVYIYFPLSNNREKGQALKDLAT